MTLSDLDMTLRNIQWHRALCGGLSATAELLVLKRNSNWLWFLHTRLICTCVGVAGIFAQTTDTSFKTAVSGTTVAGIRLFIKRWQTDCAAKHKYWTRHYRSTLTITRERPIWGIMPTLVWSTSSRMRVMNHNWSAMKQRLHPQSVAEISRHSVMSGPTTESAEPVTWYGHVMYGTKIIFFNTAWNLYLN